MRFRLAPICAAVLSTVLTPVFATVVSLPPAIVGTLDKQYRGWKLSPLIPEAMDVVRSRNALSVNLIRGDFDGNGQLDFAMIIERPGRSSSVLEFLAFLADDRDAYRKFVLKPSVPLRVERDRRFVMTLEKKGSKGHDLETGKDFVLANDAIGVWYWGVAGGRFIFENGRFRYVVGSD
jgi:hypothetical protein